MTYQDAKKKIYAKWLIGLAILVVASISTAVSALKMFYFDLDDGDAVSHAMSQPIKRLVELIYQHTHFVEYFWMYSPLPTPKALLTSQNGFFLAGYVLIFVAAALIGSAKSLSIRLAEIDRYVEDEIIRASVSNGQGRQKDEIQRAVPVLESGYFSEFHKLYIAPILGAIIVAVFMKLTGLS